MTKITAVLLEIERTDVLEDRREYEPDMLAKMYALTKEEGEDLYRLIQARFRPQARTITWATASFEAAHRLPQHDGVHGHSYVVRLYVHGPVDAEILQTYLRELLKRLDHKMLNDVLPDEPTMENIVAWVARLVPFRVARITVERPTLGLGCEWTP